MGALLDAARAQGFPAFEKLATAHAARPPHFQDRLPELLRDVRPLVVVETGVSAGVSSDWILSTLDEIGRGVLVSIDPNPFPDLFTIDHPRWVTYQMTSLDALEGGFVDPPWDVFLHDSDHEVFCETLEYEIAWHFVRPGGLILSDDYDWGTPPHDAWRKLCARHDLTWTTSGACAVARKPLDAPAAVAATDAVATLSRAKLLAKLAEQGL